MRGSIIQTILSQWGIVRARENWVRSAGVMHNCALPIHPSNPRNDRPQPLGQISRSFSINSHKRKLKLVLYNTEKSG